LLSFTVHKAYRIKLLSNAFKLAVEKTIDLPYIDIGIILDEMDLVVKACEVHL